MSPFLLAPILTVRRRAYNLLGAIDERFSPCRPMPKRLLKELERTLDWLVLAAAAAALTVAGIWFCADQAPEIARYLSKVTALIALALGVLPIRLASAWREGRKLDRRRRQGWRDFGGAATSAPRHGNTDLQSRP